MGQRKICIWAESGHLILLIVGIDVILTSILFLFKISVSPIHFAASISIAIVCYINIYKKKYQRCILSIIYLTAFIIFTAICINWFIQESAWDGNGYHKFATGILKLGWNPIYDDLKDYFAMLGIPKERINKNDLWVACYPKAVWYFDSTIYAITDYIDASKIFNLLTFFATFGICWDYFQQKVNYKRALALSIIFTGIPVSYAQLFTFYLDGSLGQLLVASVVILLSISDECVDEEYKRRQFIYLAICIILCSNLKITGLAFETAFCAIFFLYWCVKRKKILFKLGIFYFSVIFLACVIVGSAAYIKDMFVYGNPFYPAIGSNELHFSDSLESLGLENVSPFWQLITMLFVRCSTNYKSNVVEWKVPFTFNLEEIIRCKYDNIRGGGGVFFSGILCCSIVLLGYLLFKVYKNRKQEVISIVIILTVSILLMICMPAGGQARYSPYIYFIPNFAVYLLMLYMQDYSKYKKVKWICRFMVGLIFVNAIIFSQWTCRSIIFSVEYSMAYKDMKKTGKVWIDNPFPGAVFNFIDRNIEYEYNIENISADGTLFEGGLIYEIKDNEENGKK